MSADAPIPPNEVVPLHEVYIVELRDHAVVLIGLGYKKMRIDDFALAEEDDITGELVKHIQATLEDPNAPPWVDHYSVSEQVRSHAAGQFGKKRAIVDVEFQRHKRGLRPRLRFEAKRLYKNSGVAEYVGDEGLGAFLTGHYSRTHSDAGMLGYVQHGEPSYWAEKLGKRLVAPAFKIVTDGGWQPYGTQSTLIRSYCTRHMDASPAVLFVIHVLLAFQAARS